MAALAVLKYTEEKVWFSTNRCDTIGSQAASIYASQIDCARKNVNVHEVVNNSALNVTLMTVHQHFGT